MSRKIILCLVFCLAAASLFTTGAVNAPAQSKKDQKRSRDLKAEGDKAFARKEYKAAAGLYDQSIAIVANNPQAYYWRGVSNYYEKQYEAAIGDLTTALNQGFKPPIDVYRIRWYAYYDSKKLDLALADLEKAKELDPNNTEYSKGIGEIKFANGSYQESLDIYQSALTQSPNDADLYYNVARAYAALGKVDEQLKAAQTALDKHTKMIGESWYLVADANLKKRNFGGAADAFKRSIAADRKNFIAYRKLAETYRALNRLDEAIKTTKEAILEFPANGSLQSDLSWFYSLNDQPEQAVSAALAATKDLPEDALGFTNLCRAYNESKKFTDAIRSCQTALRLKPDDGETNFYLARAYDLTGRRSEATPLYSKAVKGLERLTVEKPQYADGFYFLGNAYFADNQIEKAADAYFKCLALGANFSKARYNLGIVQIRRRNRAGATDQYNALKAVDPDLAVKLKAEIDKM